MNSQKKIIDIKFRSEFILNIFRYHHNFFSFYFIDCDRNSIKQLKFTFLKMSKIRIKIKLIFIFLLIFIKIYKWTKIKIITKNELYDIKLEYNLKILIKGNA